MSQDNSLIKFIWKNPLASVKDGLLLYYVLIPLIIAAVFGMRFGSGIPGVSSAIGQAGNRIVISVWGTSREPIEEFTQNTYGETTSDNFGSDSDVLDQLNQDSELYEE